nr:ulp1 protease family, C-terminal catalytic domain-containing protein [Tanacetum cinerariifolium]
MRQDSSCRLQTEVPGIEVHNSEKDRGKHNLGGPDQTVDCKTKLAVRKGKLVVLVEKLIRNKLIKGIIRTQSQSLSEKWTNVRRSS